MNSETRRQLRLVIFLLIFGFAIMRSCQKQKQPPPKRTQRTQRTPAPGRTTRPRPGGGGRAMTLLPSGADNNNALLGFPGTAGKNPDSYLIERPQYTMSYNKDDGGPNWVSWHTEVANLGPVKRGDFRPDPLLPDDWQIRPTDYRGSGYDRGHVCPSGDRTATTEDNDATFMMSNMLPQTAALNQHVWKSLEDYCRDLANEGKELYIVAGGVGSAKRIGHGKVNVPQECWKVVVVLPQGDGDLSRVSANTRVIAVTMPNQQNSEVEHADWPQYATSVAQIEKETGFDFFSNLPANVRRQLETKVDKGA
jgi:endonuclease G